ncbi:U4/U6 snRNP-specific spliceosomal protein [Peniophora sp. CONT]|nr:U4/U6 snRNP-specific spliceosomal protein [Peniophora sp. CONT]
MSVNFDQLASDGSYLTDRARDENKIILDELERKKKARALAVPTDDKLVRVKLRELGEPITLFGERNAERRERLTYVLSQINAARGEDVMQVDEDSSSDESEEEGEEFYTPGTLELLEARRSIADYSLRRAYKRIVQQRKDAALPLARVIDIRKRVFTDVKTFSNLGSQIGDTRPVSMVRFAPDGQSLATGSWSGNVKLWNVPACTPIKTLRGHSDRVGGLAWHPQATLSQSADSVNLASGGGEGTVMLWSLNSETPISTLKGHQDRVCRVAFHPSGEYVGSASFDTTWRLWDVNTSQELLLQEGHSKEVYAIEFQDDGALVASAGLDAIGRVWDLRTGRTAMVLDGHVEGILSLSFAPNGYQIASGAADDTIRIWDVRTLKTIYSIPAHLNNVADVRFFRSDGSIPSHIAAQHAESDATEADVKMEEDDETAPENGDSTPAPNNASSNATPAPKLTPVQERERRTEEWCYRPGLYFASAGYDGVVKIWSADDWQLLHTLQTDGSKVMSVDLSSDARMLASGTYNRNFQLFAPESAMSAL